MFTNDEVAMIREAAKDPKLPDRQFRFWFQKAREGWNVPSLVLDMNAYCSDKEHGRYTKLAELLYVLEARETGNVKRRLLLAEGLKMVFMLQGNK